jgi:hypothetical protein
MAQKRRRADEITRAVSLNDQEWHALGRRTYYTRCGLHYAHGTHYVTTMAYVINCHACLRADARPIDAGNPVEPGEVTR